MEARIWGTFSLVMGLSLLAAFVTQFRNRGYVAWLGLSFVALSVASYTSRITPPHARNAALVVAAILFLISFVSAVNETRVRLRSLRRRHEAMEAQLLAMVEAEREKRKND